MIEIIGEPREATAEELRNFGYENTKEEWAEWKEALLKVFLANH